MHKLLASQLSKCTSKSGEVDYSALEQLVSAAFEEFDRDRRRTDRSIKLMVEELSLLQAGLELKVATRTSQLIERERELQDKNERFDAAVNNMVQGLVMFDAQGRVVFCNDRYYEMYDIRPDQVFPGMSLLELVQTRIESGTEVVGSLEEYCDNRMQEYLSGNMLGTTVETVDGRIISVLNRIKKEGGWVTTHEDITEKMLTQRKLDHMAHHDALTGLPNRLKMSDFLGQLLSNARRGKAFALLSLDLDHFKDVNDTMGHHIGDLLLRGVSERLRGIVRDTDLVARTGGDEFYIVQTNVESASSPAYLAERLVNAMSQPFDLGDHQFVIGTSIGITVSPDDGVDFNELMKNADMAMYQAKKDGRGGFHFFEDEMNIKAQARRLLEIDLRKALERAEFELHYQPILNISENRICGFEALLRWNHPTKGKVSPEQFIPLAEDTGLIVKIGEWVIRQACVEAKTWPSDLHVAVNVSPIQFHNNGLIPGIASTLTSTGLDANRLEIEITETVLLEHNELTSAALHQLRGLGVRISMDDFGTGYSSLSYLQSFPFDKIKIDRSFVMNINDKPESLAIVRAVVGLGKSFGMIVLAEGVETLDQLEYLRAEGVNEVQGYFFSKPIPRNNIIHLLNRMAQI